MHDGKGAADGEERKKKKEAGGRRRQYLVHVVGDGGLLDTEAHVRSDGDTVLAGHRHDATAVILHDTHLRRV
jgi:hypothetical protein